MSFVPIPYAELAAVAYMRAEANSTVQEPHAYRANSFAPEKLAVAPGGEALRLGTDRTIGQVATVDGSAGPASPIDTGHPKDLGLAGEVIGVDVDPEDGGAVIFFLGPREEKLEQAVRPPSQLSSEAPEMISGAASESLIVVGIATDPSGNALLSWAGSSGGEGDKGPGAYRALNHGFATSRVIYEAPEQPGREADEAFRAVARSGDGGSGKESKREDGRHRR